MFLLKIVLLGLLAPTLDKNGQAIEAHFDKTTGKLVDGVNLLKGRAIALCFLRPGMPARDWVPLLQRSGIQCYGSATPDRAFVVFLEYGVAVHSDAERRLVKVTFYVPPDPPRAVEFPPESERR